MVYASLKAKQEQLFSSDPELAILVAPMLLPFCPSTLKRWLTRSPTWKATTCGI
jgi:hypothetical protein